MVMFLFHIFLICSTILITISVEVDLDFHTKYGSGENRYREMVEKTYGDCWKEALSSLHAGCKHLTEDTQSRLALSFTNCFLKHSGSNICLCPKETLISDCLRNASDRVFSTYTEFFTHTQSICHYLQHREWQQQTEKTVMMLTESSETVSRKIDESSKSQSKILEMQQLSLLEQKRLISNGRTLNVELQKSRDHARNVFDEFKSTTNDQRLLIFEVFDRIKSLQNVVLGEFTNVFTFAYYIAAVFLAYLLTSVPSTASARLSLLLLIILNVLIERTLVTFSLDEEMSKVFPLDASGPMYMRIWFCRKVFCFAGSVILFYHYHRYKDYNAMNNQLLREIQRQNSEIQEFIKNVDLGELSPQCINLPKIEVISPSSTQSQVTVSKKLHSDTNSNDENLGASSFPSLNTSNSKAISPNRTETQVVVARKFSSNISPQLQSNILEESLSKTKQIVEKTPKMTRKRNTKNNTPKENILLAKENILEQGSSPNRYNLRSRVNSPAQSPYNSNSPLLPNDLANAIAKSFGKT